MRNPTWFSHRYPTQDDLVSFAYECGAVVGVGPCPGPLFVPPESVEDGSPALLLIPSHTGLLERAYFLAHELGHLVMHSGAVGPYRSAKVEAQADHWAVRALIPEAAIRRHGNASLDAFIAALSSHYEHIPPVDCPLRRLAAKIARIRIRVLEEVA